MTTKRLIQRKYCEMKDYERRERLQKLRKKFREHSLLTLLALLGS